MREKYESLALLQLKELAKVRGIKGASTMKKGELVEAMLAEDERQKKLAQAAEKSAEQLSTGIYATAASTFFIVCLSRN